MVGDLILNLDEITGPEFLKKLDNKELILLAKDIRKSIIDVVSTKGGHLSSNLGVVELTIALHTVFNAPKDKIIFDVGHQSYTHKILTGRYNEFKNSLRDFKGISGYQKIKESEYDCYEAGHSSTSISAACGFLKAQEINLENNEIIAVIGDSSITSGLALEGLNNLSSIKGKVIIVLNDNGMAISRPVGGVSKTFSKIRSSITYTSTKNRFRKILSKIPFGAKIHIFLRYLKNSIRRLFIETTLFENFNLDYIGPIDGHNIKKMIKAFNVAKNSHKSIVVHVVTKKGFGYKPAEDDKYGKWHGVEKFDVFTGEFSTSNEENSISWSEAIANIVHEFMIRDSKIVTITPAMIEGSKLSKIFRDFSNRSIDVGISEEHAFTMSGSMYLGGLHPYISIYSTFLQRAYDEVCHDVARMNLPLVVGVDRAGIVGKDGDTHQGIFDVAFLKTIPNTIIAMPKDYDDAKKLYEIAFQYKNLFFIRYPRGKTKIESDEDKNNVYIGKWDLFESNASSNLNIIVTGPNFDIVRKKLSKEKIDSNLVFARFYKPIDKDVLKKICDNGKTIIVYDIYSTKEGLYDSICEYMIENKYNSKVINLSVPTDFIQHGNIDEILISLNLSIDDLVKIAKGELK